MYFYAEIQFRVKSLKPQFSKYVNIGTALAAQCLGLHTFTFTHSAGGLGSIPIRELRSCKPQMWLKIKFQYIN